MTPLAAPDDVAHAMGLADHDEFTAAQAARVDALLVRISRDYRRESERTFTPGTTTVRLLTVAGVVRLTEPVDTVGAVEVPDYGSWVDADDFTVDGQEVAVFHHGRLLGTGVAVKVTYTHTAAVPDDVVADVAAIAARHLGIDPDAPERTATDLGAGPFRVKYADWTSSTSLLTEEEKSSARRYRYPGSTVVVQRP